ncbi:MAG: DUF4238 domain-containing protein [Chitinophagaceae bacterium]
MKSNDPIQHHYVPQVYLKGFTNEKGDLIQYDIKYKTFAQKKPAQVGYKIDYFKIQRPETKIINQITDEYLIEKNSFTEQENNYPKLVSQITGNTDSPFAIARKQLELLVATLITIKRRNPSFKETMTGEIKNHAASDAFKNQVAPYMELARQIDKQDPEIYIETVKEQFRNEPSKSSDLYISSFLDPYPSIVKQVTETLLASQTNIWYVPPGIEFITSDNPGFILSGTEVLNFGGLGGSHLFAFPLTPAACIVIDSEVPALLSIESTMIHPKVVENWQVKMINQATAKVAMSKLFARNKSSLAHL